MPIALTHIVSPNIHQCELSFRDRIPINYEIAVQQHKNYSDKLTLFGLRVIELDVNKELPDSTFVEDMAVIVDEIAVLTSPGAKSRRAEVAGIGNELEKYRKLAAIRLPATLDGGDVLQIGRTIFVGQSKRTNELGFTSLKKILEPFGYYVIPVVLKNCLHLKSACTALDEKTVIVNPDWLDVQSLMDFRMIEVDVKEPDAANTLKIHDTILMQAGFPKTINRVIKSGYLVETIDISELRKAEAGLTCSSIIFQDVEKGRGKGKNLG